MTIVPPDNKDRRLLAAYETVTRLYSRAVSELARQRGVLPLDAYNRLRERVEQARINCGPVGNRCGVRVGVGVRAHTADESAALRRVPSRSADVCHGVGRLDGCGHACQSSAGAQGN